MAQPTLTANSPSAGYISWTAFNIAYAGVGYPVAAGNTADKYVWWDYNGGAPAIMTSNTAPTLAVDDLLLFLNRDGIPVSAQGAKMIDGDLIVKGTVLGEHLVVDAIGTRELKTEELIVGGSLSNFAAGYDPTTKETPQGAQAKADVARTGAVGDLKNLWGLPSDTTYINGGMLANKTVLTSSLIVSDFTNYAAVGNCEDADIRAAYPPPSSYWSYSTVTRNGGKWGIVLSNPGSYATMSIGEAINCNPGDKFFMSADIIKTSATSDGDVSLNLVGYNEQWQVVNYDISASVAPKTAGQSVWGTYSGDFTVPANVVHMQPQLKWRGAAGIGRWVFDELVIKRQVGGELIVDGAIDGKIITGATIQTDAGNVGVKLNNSGLLGYDSAGNLKTQIDANTGQINATGSLYMESGSQFAGLDVIVGSGPTAPGPDSDGPGLILSSGGGFGEAFVYSSTYYASPYSYGELTLTSPWRGDGRDGSYAAEFSLTTSTQLGATSAALRAGEVRIHDGSYGITISDGKIGMENPATTTASSNVNYFSGSGNGWLRHVTSSRTVKDNITPLVQNFNVDQLLSLEPKTFTSLCEGDDPGLVMAGFIAEEAHDLGLAPWVEYREDGTPRSFFYDRWPAALQEIVRHLRDRIDILEQRLDAAS